MRAILCIFVSLLVIHAIQGENAWDADLAAMKNSLTVLSQQVIMQKLEMEERVRSSGASGIKIIRLNTKGTNPYLTQTYTRKSNSAIHDHSNNIRTIGMGEVVVVLNGVEFRTRHNDYRLYMPSKTTKDYGAYVDVPFPDVPKEVTEKGSVSEQVEEMREWFKAFRNQDHSVRDYRPYFKAVLCYMEGMWTFSDPDKIDEPFASDRHTIEADSWFDLQQKVRFTASTGTKNNLENFAYLPTTIAGLINGTVVVIAQWNYNILCHPVSRDLPLNRFKMIDDFSSRMVQEYSMARQQLTRAARFELNPLDTDEWPDKEFSYFTGLMDDLMYEIPGKDNYLADLDDTAFDMSLTRPNGDRLNAGFYHRVFKNTKKDAMGLQLIQRGFNDANCYVALNTREKVMGLSYQKCTGRPKARVCEPFEQKISYAIPLEIIYLTPLYEWNPHNITYRGTFTNDNPDSLLVKADGRNGDLSDDKAYDGIHSKLYYKTPIEFFEGSEVEREPADTSSDSIAVLDGNGKAQSVSASGTRVFLPKIQDLGTIRTRFPINPTHDEGSVSRKELEAVKMAYLEMGRYQHMIRTPLGTAVTSSLASETIIKTGDSDHVDVTPHFHTIEVSSAQMKLLMYGNETTAYTDEAAGHRHYITFKYASWKSAYMMQECDDKWKCWDLHPREMYEVVNSDGSE